MAELDLGTSAQQIRAALDEVDALCRGQYHSGGHVWRMSVPADEDRDSDLILEAGLTAGRHLIARVRELECKNTQQGMLLAGLLSKSDRDDAHIAELEAARDQP